MFNKNLKNNFFIKYLNVFLIIKNESFILYNITLCYFLFEFSKYI